MTMMDDDGWAGRETRARRASERDEREGSGA